ncbi:hypothetical protein [Mesorhizobium sp. ES1-1]|uniref:hypothetical protein n=1 Tax=Mesorhizobium sp. ES1-1 TaxID=2876629 RepID=UPI001CCF528C|nr:hypothetical protein [Mesorhizobium sp. ES1-1]MBZ9678937.1 hypothetical protein [Mesorhizobium sp. ES1-1]
MRLTSVSGLVGAALCLAACVTKQPTDFNRPYALSEVEQKIVKFGVATSLKDPGSPIFGNMAASISDKGVVQVCGTVNAKNSYGAYTGLQPYLGVLATSGAGNKVFVVNGIAGPRYSAQAVIMTCAQRGIGGGIDS